MKNKYTLQEEYTTLGVYPLNLLTARRELWKFLFSPSITLHKVADVVEKERGHN